MSTLRSAIKKVFISKKNDPYTPPNAKKLSSKEKEVLITTCAAIAIPILIAVILALAY